MLKVIDNRWTESEYLLFRDEGLYREGGKTRHFNVTTKDGGVLLGNIHWFNKWRQYAFFPATDSLFEHKCMRDIADFIHLKTKDHYTAAGINWTK